jgi:hypothetical protein
MMPYPKPLDKGTMAAPALSDMVFGRAELGCLNLTDLLRQEKKKQKVSSTCLRSKDAPGYILSRSRPFCRPDSTWAEEETRRGLGFVGKSIACAPMPEHAMLELKILYKHLLPDNGGPRGSCHEAQTLVHRVDDAARMSDIGGLPASRAQRAVSW